MKKLSELLGKQLAQLQKGHPDWAELQCNLGSKLRARYLRTEIIADLEEAIRITREAVSATPEDHPNRAELLKNLADRLMKRYRRIRPRADLEEAMSTYDLL